jgi:hypothetical protein
VVKRDHQNVTPVSPDTPVGVPHSDSSSSLREELCATPVNNNQRSEHGTQFSTLSISEYSDDQYGAREVPGSSERRGRGGEFAGHRRSVDYATFHGRHQVSYGAGGPFAHGGFQRQQGSAYVGGSIALPPHLAHYHQHTYDQHAHHHQHQPLVETQQQVVKSEYPDDMEDVAADTRSSAHPSLTSGRLSSGGRLLASTGDVDAGYARRGGGGSSSTSSAGPTEVKKRYVVDKRFTVANRISMAEKGEMVIEEAAVKIEK